MLNEDIFVLLDWARYLNRYLNSCFQPLSSSLPPASVFFFFLDINTQATSSTKFLFMYVTKYIEMKVYQIQNWQWTDSCRTVWKLFLWMSVSVWCKILGVGVFRWKHLLQSLLKYFQNHPLHIPTFQCRSQNVEVITSNSIMALTALPHWHCGSFTSRDTLLFSFL